MANLFERTAQQQIQQERDAATQAKVNGPLLRSSSPAMIQAGQAFGDIASNMGGYVDPRVQKAMLIDQVRADVANRVKSGEFEFGTPKFFQYTAQKFAEAGMMEQAMHVAMTGADLKQKQATARKTSATADLEDRKVELNFIKANLDDQLGRLKVMKDNAKTSQDHLEIDKEANRIANRRLDVLLQIAKINAEATQKAAPKPSKSSPTDVNREDAADMALSDWYKTHNKTKPSGDVYDKMTKTTAQIEEDIVSRDKRIPRLEARKMAVEAVTSATSGEGPAWFGLKPQTAEFSSDKALQQERKLFGEQAPPIQAETVSEGNYKTVDDVKAAYKAGKLTQDEATTLLQKQFGYSK